MENPEEILHSLEEFTKMKPRDIPNELEDYLKFVAKTGDPVYQWSAVKSLFREKLINVITEFYESSSVEIQTCRNIEIFNYDLMKNFILEKLDTFNAAPFTLQRISELLTNPRKEYSRIDKFMRALEKNILVVSTTEPGRRTTENGDSIVNGIESDQYSMSETNNDVNVEEMDYTPSWPQQETAQTANHISTASTATAEAVGATTTTAAAAAAATTTAQPPVDDQQNSTNTTADVTPMEIDCTDGYTATTTTTTTSSNNEGNSDEASSSSTTTSQEVICVQFVSTKELPANESHEKDKETIRSVNIETENATVNSEFATTATTQIEETETVIESNSNVEETNPSTSKSLTDEPEEINIQNTAESNKVPATAEADSCGTNNQLETSSNQEDNIPTTSSDYVSTQCESAAKLVSTPTDVRITCSDVPSNENSSSSSSTTSDNCSNSSNIIFNETSSSSSSSTSTSSIDSETTSVDKTPSGDDDDEVQQINADETSVSTATDVSEKQTDDADSTTATVEVSSAGQELKSVEESESIPVDDDSMPGEEKPSTPPVTTIETSTTPVAPATEEDDQTVVERTEHNLEADSSTLYETEVDRDVSDDAPTERMDISQPLQIDLLKDNIDMSTQNEEVNELVETVSDSANQEQQPQSSSDLSI